MGGTPRRLWARGGAHAGGPGTAWDAGERSGTIAALAAAAAADAAMRAARSCVLAHGAIGFTWEHDAHRYLARAMWTVAHLGGVSGQRARAADLLLDSSGPHRD